MPLSEEELRMLEQMERALSEEDPKFASTLRGTAFRRAARRRMIIAGCVFAAGVAMLLGGAITQLPALGIAGFVVMLGSSIIGLSVLRGKAGTPAAAEGAPEPQEHPGSGFTVHPGGKQKSRGKQQKGPKPGLRERMEERWRRRQQHRGF